MKPMSNLYNFGLVAAPGELFHGIGAVISAPLDPRSSRRCRLDKPRSASRTKSVTR